MTPLKTEQGKDFIEYDEALKLKGLGFDLECDYFYISLPNGKHTNHPTKWYRFPENWNLSPSRLSAPSYLQVFGWFTRTKRLHSFVRIGTSGKFSYEIWELLGDAKGWAHKAGGGATPENDLTLTHLTCLQHLIKLTETI